jgi:predicted permease
MMTPVQERAENAFLAGHDLRVACRGLAHQPAFTLMIVGILAIGVAGMTTVFGLFNGLFLRPFPVPTEKRLTYLYETDRKTAQGLRVAYPRFHAWQQYNQTFECMGFYSVWAVTISLGDKAERIGIRMATHDYLQVLGLHPVLGRYFTAQEDRPGGPNVALVSFSLWERLFAKDPALLGRTVGLDGDPFTIIGVLPPEADFPSRKDVWLPLRADAGGHGGMVALRWSAETGRDLEQAREDLARIHQGWAQQNPEQQVTTQPAVLPFREMFRELVKQYQLGLSVLQGVVGFAMLTACCNVASILLARGAFQTREFALRAALGASRGRIIRHVLMESLVLFAAGGSLGVVVGQRALALLLSRVVSVVPPWMHFSLDVHCVLFCLAIVGVGTLLSGLLPALHAAFARDVHGVLQSAGTRTTISRGRRRTLNVVVTTEIALALALLVCAGLLLRTFHQVRSIDPGFRKAGVLTYNLHFPVGPYLDESKRRAFWEQHLERIRALPGVRQAAWSDYIPGGFAPFDEFDGGPGPYKVGAISAYGPPAESHAGVLRDPGGETAGRSFLCGPGQPQRQ